MQVSSIFKIPSSRYFIFPLFLKCEVLKAKIKTKALCFLVYFLTSVSHSQSPAFCPLFLYSTDIAPLKPTIKANSCQIPVDIFQPLSLLVIFTALNSVHSLFLQETLCALDFHHIILIWFSLYVSNVLCL